MDAGSAQTLDLQQEFDSIKAAVDTGFLLTAAFLVFLMQAGFALLESGSTRLQNSATIFMKNVGDTLISMVCFFFLGGWTIAFAEGNGFMGTSSYTINDSDAAFAFFQATFCSAAATIVSGALIGRVKFSSYFLFTFWMSLIVYPPVAHWVWSADGWLSLSLENPPAGRPLLDFAGGGVVHLVGGAAALVGAYLIGPRKGFIDAKTGEVNSIPGHSITLVGLGTLILWFGWYGFNVGSILTISNGGHLIASVIAINTTICATSAGLGSIIIQKLILRKNLDAGGVLNSVLAGLVASTSGCNIVSYGASLFIGFVSSFVYYGSEHAMKYAKIDDPVGAVPVHMSNGIWSLIAVGLFAEGDNNGLFFGDGTQFAVQLLGVLVITLWSMVVSAIGFAVVNRILGVRVSKVTELRGLDDDIGAAQHLEIDALKHLFMEVNGFEQLLETPSDPLVWAFHAYLVKENLGSYLDFLLNVRAFHDYVDLGEKDERELRHRFNNIFRVYLGSSRDSKTLHLPGHIRQNVVREANAAKLSKFALDSAAEEVTRMLSKGPWKRFVRELRQSGQPPLLTAKAWVGDEEDSETEGNPRTSPSNLNDECFRVLRSGDVVWRSTFRVPNQRQIAAAEAKTSDVNIPVANDFGHSSVPASGRFF